MKRGSKRKGGYSRLTEVSISSSRSRCSSRGPILTGRRRPNDSSAADRAGIIGVSRSRRARARQLMKLLRAAAKSTRRVRGARASRTPRSLAISRTRAHLLSAPRRRPRGCHPLSLEKMPTSMHPFIHFFLFSFFSSFSFNTNISLPSVFVLCAVNYRT